MARAAGYAHEFASGTAMLINFFFTLRAAKLKVSVKEYLTLLEAIKSGVIDDEEGPSVDRFYYLARTALVKDEAQFDKFDRAFAAYFKGVEMLTDFTRTSRSNGCRRSSSSSSRPRRRRRSRRWAGTS
jgi:uncharacterized protein with von Willebrand factor type A (vWA) domain